MSEKLSSIERALVATTAMSTPDARRVLMLICESGTELSQTESGSLGIIHFAKRERFIKRMKSAVDRVLDYAKHETLRNCEKHFRDTQIASAEETQPTVSRI